MRFIAICSAALILSSIVALAADPPFVGTWSLDPANCTVGQETQDAPLIVAADRYDQHETHCTFKSVDEKDADFKIASECTIEGSATPYDFTLTVSGDTLTFTDEHGARDFLRCN